MSNANSAAIYRRIRRSTNFQFAENLVKRASNENNIQAVGAELYDNEGYFIKDSQVKK